MGDLDRQEIGTRLTELRNAKGYTQVDLSKLLGVSSESVKKWEYGQAIPRPGVLYKLSILYDTSIDYLLAATDNKARH